MVRYVTYTKRLPAVRRGLKLVSEVPSIAKKKTEMKIKRQSVKGP